MSIQRNYSWTRKQPIVHQGRMLFLIYRNIPGHERYQVTVTGLIYDSYRNQFMKQYRSREVNPYRIVNFGNSSYLVHRLVAITWLPNPENLPEVDHIDGDTFNNWIDNLRWCTHEQNIKYKHERIRKVREFLKTRTEMWINRS